MRKKRFTTYPWSYQNLHQCSVEYCSNILLFKNILYTCNQRLSFMNLYGILNKAYLSQLLSVFFKVVWNMFFLPPLVCDNYSEIAKHWYRSFVKHLFFFENFSLPKSLIIHASSDHFAIHTTISQKQNYLNFSFSFYVL